MAKIKRLKRPEKNAGLEYVNLLINSMTHSLDPFMIMCNAKDVNYDDKLCVS